MRIGDLPRGGLEEARRLLAVACAYDAADRVAEEKLFGDAPAHPSATLGAWDDGGLVGVAVVSGRWLRLLAVAPAARGRGVGGALLEESYARARAFGATRLRSGDQAGNYLAPGIDVRNEAVIGWLGRRGWAQVAEYENLSVPLAGNPKVTAERAAALAARTGYEIRRARVDDLPALATYATVKFAKAWAFEIEKALQNDPPGVFMAVAPDGEIAGFACHDGNNRGLGWFGPAGTSEEHRGKGLGQALLIPCLLDVAAAGHSEGVIAWIGPRPFYESAAGALSGRRFVVLQKDPI